jgi:hypothetical protein
MPSTRADFKKLTIVRLEGAKLLSDGGDFDSGAYLMGCALECALKASICKALRISKYPDEHHKDDKIPSFFMTHSFVRLLLLSGLSDIFDVKGTNQLAYKNWSDFTVQYVGEWTSMRYRYNQFNKQKIVRLYDYLYSDKDSIIKTINRAKRW